MGAKSGTNLWQAVLETHGDMTDMLTFTIILILLLILDMAARYWGVDSTDKMESCEWRRRRWRDEQKDGERIDEREERNKYDKAAASVLFC
jgi:hypothetical protein